MSLFQHYRATPGSVREAGRSIATSTSSVQSVASSARSSHRTSLLAVDGLLEAPMAGAIDPVTSQASGVTTSAAFAGTVVVHFASAIQTYNQGIDELNRIWDAAGPHYGVSRPQVAADADAEEREAAEAEFASDVASAKEALRGDLVRRKGRLKADLDDAADEASSFLTTGPTAANMTVLSTSGALDSVFTWLKEAYGNPIDMTTGLAFGISESMLTLMSHDVLKRYMPDRINVPPSQLSPFWRNVVNRQYTWVNGYLRRTPTGSSTQVNGHWRRLPGRSAQWASRAKWIGRGGMAAGFITAGWQQWASDANLPTDQRVGRTVTQSVTVGGAGALGGWAGAAGGAAIGTAICPGVGTVIGGLVGGLVVGGGASWLADKFNDSIVEWGGEAGEWASDRVDDAKEVVSDIGDGISDAWDSAGDALDSITPW